MIVRRERWEQLQNLYEYNCLNDIIVNTFKKSIDSLILNDAEYQKYIVIIKVDRRLFCIYTVLYYVLFCIYTVYSNKYCT